jgi:hypothetical protein
MAKVPMSLSKRNDRVEIEVREALGASSYKSVHRRCLGDGPFGCQFVFSGIGTSSSSNVSANGSISRDDRSDRWS